MIGIRKVGVCGAAGTMGSGIAIVSARAGFETVCHDVDEEGLERAASQTASFFARSVERGRMTEEDREAALGRLSPATELDALAGCDLVIEAVFEDLSTKQALFRALNPICKEEAIFASNTSTLSITQIASGCGREDRVVGMPFLPPRPAHEADRDVARAEYVRGGVRSRMGVDRSGRPEPGADPGPSRLHPQRAAGALQQRRDPRGRGRRREPGGYRHGDQGSARLQDGAAGADRPDRARYPDPALGGVLPDHPRSSRRRAAPPSPDGRGRADWAASRAAASTITKAARCTGHDDGLCGSPDRREPFVSRRRLVPRRRGGRRECAGSARRSLRAGPVQDGDPDRARDRMPRRSHRRGGRRGGLERGRFRALPEPAAIRRRSWSSWSVRPTPRSARSRRRAPCSKLPGSPSWFPQTRVGRIVDRLVRPKYNAALRLLDDGLAKAEDMDLACRLGLGYPDGPVERAVRGGLAYHHEVSSALFATSGQPGDAPARAAVVARARFDGR